MRIIRRTLATLLAIVLFTCVAALAVASPPVGNPAGGCGQGTPAGQYGGPGHQYGPKGPPVTPPGGGNGAPANQYGPPGNQYAPGNPSPGPPNGCPSGGQYGGQYRSP